MRNLVVIPARGGSKRLPNKNIKVLGGIPLLVHSINYAKDNRHLNLDIVVSTDHAEIKKIALANGVQVIDRPKEISEDWSTTVSVMKHTIETLDTSYNHVVLLQPTNPLRPKQMLQTAFKKYTDENYDSLMTVSKNEHKLGKIIKDRFVPYTYQLGQRSQDLEPLYYENGLLYIAKTSLILQGQILGENNYPMIVDHPFSNIDIDTLEDFELAEFYYKKYKYE